MTPEKLNYILDRICSGIGSSAERKDARDELYDHIMNHYEKNIALGMTEEEAYSEAVEALGDREKIEKDLTRAHRSVGRYAVNVIAVVFTAASCCFLLPAAAMISSMVQGTYVISVIEGLLDLVILLMLFLSIKTRSVIVPIVAAVSLIFHFMSYGFISVITVFFEFVTGNFKNFLSDAVPGEIISTPLGVFFKVLLTVIIIALAVFICVYNYRRFEYGKSNKKALKAAKMLLGALSIFIAFSVALAIIGYKLRMTDDYYKKKDRNDKEYFILYAETKEEAEELLDISESAVYDRLGRTADGIDEKFYNDTYIIRYHHDIGSAVIFLEHGNEDNVKLDDLIELKKSAFYIKVISRAEIEIDKQSGYLITIPYSARTGLDNDSATIIPLPLSEEVTLHGYQNGNAEYEIILRQKQH